MRKFASLLTAAAVVLGGLGGLAVTAPSASAATLSCGATGGPYNVGDAVTVGWNLDVPNGSGFVEIYDPSGSKVGGVVVPQDAPLTGSTTLTVSTAGTYEVRCLAADDQLNPVATPSSTFDVKSAPAPVAQITSCQVSVNGDSADVSWTTSTGVGSFLVGLVNPKDGAAAQVVAGGERKASVSLAAESAGLLTVVIEPDGDDTRAFACPDFTYTPPTAQPPTVTLGEAKTNNTKRQQWLNISWSAPAIGWRSPNLSGYDAILSFATGLWVPCGFTGDFIAVGQGIPDSAPVRVTAPCAPATASLTLTALDATTVQGEFTVTPDFSVVRSLKYWTLIDGQAGPFVDLSASPTDKKVTFVISKLPPGKSVTVLSLVSFYEAPLLLDPRASINMPAVATAELTYNPTGATGAFSKSAFAGTPLSLNPILTPSGRVARSYAAVGALPPGLVLNSATGVISGTPRAAWTGTVTVTASLTDGSTASQALTFTVTAPPAGAALAYQDVTVRSGDPFAVAPTVRPAGQTFTVSSTPAASFTVSATGVVGGTAPTVATTTSYKVTVTAANPAETATFTVTVNPLPGVAPSGTAVTSVTPGTGANGGSTGAGGGSSGSVGSGLSASPCLAPEGQIYSDLAGSVGSTLTMAPNLTGLRPATGFSVVGGALPQGVWLDSQVGVISGTPLRSNGGRGPVTIQTTFVDGSVRQTVMNIAVDDPHHAINYPNRTIGSVGQDVVVAPLDVHTQGKRTYRIVCGTLLPGLKFDAATGEISGTPTSIVERPVPLRVRMTDDYGWVDSSFLIVVNQGITPWVRYPDYAQLDVRSRTIIDPTRSGLPGTTTYTLTGRLPKGLTFDKVTGAIYGTPQAANAKVFHPTVRARSKAGVVVASTQLSIAVTKSAVPMKVTARGAAKHLRAGATTLVARVQHPTYAVLSAKVTCGSCTHTFNKKTGRLVVRTSAKTSTVKVMIVARPRGAPALKEFTAHTWTRTWKGPGSSSA